jgi:hypothetical protein
MKQLNLLVMQIAPKDVDKQAVREQQETLEDAILQQWGIKNRKTA